jgi:hypothetical protein
MSAQGTQRRGSTQPESAAKVASRYTADRGAARTHRWLPARSSRRGVRGEAEQAGKRSSGSAPGPAHLGRLQARRAWPPAAACAGAIRARRDAFGIVRAKPALVAATRRASPLFLLAPAPPFSRPPATTIATLPVVASSRRRARARVPRGRRLLGPCDIFFSGSLPARPAGGHPRIHMLPGGDECMRASDARCCGCGQKRALECSRAARGGALRTSAVDAPLGWL